MKLIKTIMAKLQTKRFLPTQEEKAQGEQPMSQVEILEALTKYKVQNPTKYAQKKEALFARYGLDLNDEPEELKDENDKELEQLKEKITKKSKAK